MTDQEQEQSITASLFGQSVAAKGTSGIIILVLLCLAGSLAYLLYDRAMQTERHMDRIATDEAMSLEKQAIKLNGEHSEIAATLRGLQDALKESAEAQRVQNYLNLADDKERQAIKKHLTMPDSLRREMNKFHD